MIKVYADLHKEQDIVYIEDVISAHDMHTIKKDDLKKLIDDMVGKYGSLHTSYPDFLSRVGRFVSDYGKRWCGQEFVVYTTVVKPGGVETKKKEKHKFDLSGHLSSWSIGYF
jgi:hypothetical protein